MPRTHPKMVATATELRSTTTLDRGTILCIYLLLLRHFGLEVQQYPAILPRHHSRADRMPEAVRQRLSCRASSEEAGSVSQPEWCRRKFPGSEFESRNLGGSGICPRAGAKAGWTSLPIA